jgi:hypothetical protein
MRALTLILFSAAAICLAIGCTARDDNQQAPAVTPSNAAVPEGYADAPVDLKRPDPVRIAPADIDGWLQISPVRMNMRSMWVSSGLIVAFSAGRYNADFDAIEGNARNIERKAANYANMWDAVRTENRAIAEQARERNWDQSREHSQRLWAKCSYCHVESWSMETRGILQESIDGWLENGTAAERVPYSGLRLASPDAFLGIMLEMVAQLDRTMAGIERQDGDLVMRNTQAMDRIIGDQVERWRAVELEARLIAEIAAKSDVLNIDRRYARMIRACNDCHATFVQDDREPLDPLPWKYR